ncbi:Peptidyl-prolyl cis-trans isomerase [Lasiodiplodia theobromae]|uniref:Peptidyl-prolyl cis-trans isomerase n=1 Tax=Lasiodiplodia theobromae TaxID=45133 RepID=UPI0015C40195|nr:Peptidyl-prolyl cis-trans isomerase [Lasiodiplodia theobromae]KAF4537154.1 Peptidyl-prolyl cis-trans isomerase [Lasiodiplodia theobromae]
MAKTLYEKLFEQHVVCQQEDGQYLLYIDRHLIYECTSPQAFDGLRAKNRAVRRPDLSLATTDHTVPTSPRSGCTSTASYIQDADSLTQCLTLSRNARHYRIAHLPLSSARQGIVHVIGPELGFTQPGLTLVCGDSHTSTHGAFGALAFGIGTSEVQHVLATQTLLATKSRTIRINVANRLRPHVAAKDLALAAIRALGGTAGGTGAALEFAGEGVAALDMEQRMALCNMAIEAGARTGLVAPDATTIAYLRWRPGCPAPGTAAWRDACRYWRTLRSDDDAVFDREVHVDAAAVEPMVTWGTSPEHAVPVSAGVVPKEAVDDGSSARALEYMGLEPGKRLTDLAVDVVFIGSCTNSRLSDLRAAAGVLRRARSQPAVVAPNVRRALVVPGSGAVKRAAEAEGLDQVFLRAGFEWREPGCSMCCGLNGDALRPGERCASTSNRNFENRQGAGGRTHLVSPASAAAAALMGRLCDVREVVAASAGEEEETAKPVRDIAFQLDWESPSRWEEQVDEPQPQGLPSPPSSDAGGVNTFTSITGTPAPLDRANIDTDTILPVNFCKTIQRSGAGLFHQLRHLPGTTDEDPAFVLNQHQYRSATVLVAGPNFGCGSSREHAVWALQGFGFQCIVAPSFADIFYNNAFKNGLLPVKLPDKHAMALVLAEAKRARPITVDLVRQEIRNEGCNVIATFDVEKHRKRRLIEGTDDISATLEMEKDISNFERQRAEKLPWIDESVKFLHDIEGRAKELWALHDKSTDTLDW